MKNEKNYVEKILEYRKTGDKKLKDEVILDHIDLVKNIAKTFSKGSNLSIDELESYGYEGLLVAFSKFNPERSLNFENYAYAYISGFIKSGILDVKGNNHEFYVDYQEVRRNVEEVYGVSVLDEPKLVDTIVDVLVKLNYIGKTKDSIELAKRKINIDIFGNESLNDEKTVNKLIKDGTFVNPIDYSNVAERKVLHDDLMKVLSKLSVEEQELLKGRFGFYNDEEMTFQQLGELFNYSSTLAGRKVSKALEKLRLPSRSKYIKSYVNDMEMEKYHR